MASNESYSSCWRVRIKSLPPSITSDELAQTFNLSIERITIPKNQRPVTYLAWINGFVNEKDAKDFVERWSGSFISGTTIKCCALEPKNSPSHSQHPSSNLIKSDIDSDQNMVISNEFNDKSSNTMTSDTRAAKKSVVRRSTPKTNVVDKRPLSQEKSYEYKHDQQRYDGFDNDSELNSRSSSSIISLLSSNLEEYDESGGRTRSNSITSSTYSINSTQITYTRRKSCHYGLECFKVDCEFEHPIGWNACSDGVICDNYECSATHPSKRKAKCRDGDRCKRSNCRFLHPKTRAEECRWRGKCKKWDCPKLHPPSRARPCSDKEKCTNLACSCIHPPERQRLLCCVGADCRDLSCQLNHPPERPVKCVQGDSCSNCNCIRLHSPNWNPREAKDDYENEHCLKISSLERNMKSLSTKKSSVQKMKDWEKAQLPILSYRSEFCQRLENEQILVVTAETGSGKSTQLPQYAAEYFGSLVVCTQPRVVAALSLACRVAEEYDGTSVGESVGYKVGHGKRVAGNSIMFMTDAALIRQSQADPTLKDIRVLIIDEAHERSLNTDIVLGLAKLLHVQRPKDFYVVIASATIDPSRFLQFFDRSTNLPLEVKGRVFPVSVANKSPPSDCSEGKLIEKHIIPSLIELYPEHQGHTLVFLPGQGEIEKALKIFQFTIPDDCIALPLYGSQSPEEQQKVIQFNEKNKRLVVFCTNVAETSLTIPNVRLVIDSGWAKEARYDVKRRLTVIETVRISCSSADQRKGRAGRTASGHCVRLYDNDELKRANIQPEILRSSLDLILLQLIRLNFDPKTFPFMDQPQIDTIIDSIDLLVRLKCIDNEKITKRGELFTELGLDPRLSAFIIQIYIEYESLLELVAGIVGILSAPGTIFFRGGTTREEKQEAKMKIARQAQNYQSDLLHLYLVYNAWKNATTKQTEGKCFTCLKQVKWCICRIKHSNENNLNNKILQIVHTTTKSIIKQIQNRNVSSWLKSENKIAENPMEILSEHLSQLFPEQCGYLLVPQLPIEGVRLISTDIRANISHTSTFMQKLHTDSNDQLYQYFIAMNITQLSSGNYIIERLHPISRSLVTIQSQIQRLVIIENISSQVFYSMRRKLYNYRLESWAKWLVYQYDRIHCRFILSGFESEKSKVEPIVQSIHQEVFKKFYDDYELIECGLIKATFQSGLICTHIHKMSKTLRLDLKNVPNLSFSKLKDWVKENMKIEWDEIKRYGFWKSKVETNEENMNNQRQNVYLIFKNENAFRQANNQIPVYYLNDEQIHRDYEKDLWGREILLQTPSYVTIQDILQRYGINIITDCIQLNKSNPNRSENSSLKLNNLPVTTDEIFLRKCLRISNGPQPKYLHVGHAKNNASGWAKVTFNNVEQRDLAASIYRSELCENIFSITYQGKRGLKSKPVRTTLQIDEPTRSSAKNYFRITMINREETLRLLSTYIPSQWILESSATVTILRSDLYSNLQQIVDHISEKFSVKVKFRNLPNNIKRYTFNGARPQQTSLAASMFAQYFAPMNIKLTTDRQKYLFEELEQVGQLENWAVELCLSITKNKSNTNIEIRGTQIAQGQLMRRIADYSDDFNQRFRSFELSTTLTAFFGPQKAASSQLQEINSQWLSKSCSVFFLPKTSTIIILGKPNVLLEDLNQCEKEVVVFLHELIGTTNDDENEEEEDVNILRQDRQCVFCEENSSISMNLFRICGHGYCRCAARFLSTSPSFPLRCKDCQTYIHIKDIEIIFNNSEQFFLRLLKTSIEIYLKNHSEDDDRVFCPNDQCDGLIKFNRGYQICLTGGHYVCGKCQIIDNDFHLNRTCDDLIQRNKSVNFISQLFNAARQFLEDNWPINSEMRPINRIDQNPYLEKRYKSLRRFYQGVKQFKYSLPFDLSKGVFAYHGTSPQAISLICENGFDPRRRSGQVHGPGEYFGITATVSHGYTAKHGQTSFRQMIIAFLLQCSKVTRKDNFCYVVENPIDWKYAFNLPVLVVTYGSMSDIQPSPFSHFIPDFIDDEDQSSWKLPFRWYYRHNNGQFQVFNDQINRILEQGYVQWKFHRGSSTIVTPLLMNSSDNNPQIYQIDYQNNRQINLNTSSEQTIERRSIDNLSNHYPHWFVRDEHEQWIQYESSIEDLISKAFQSYRSGQGSAIIDISNHRIHFLTGEQINLKSNISQGIKYETGYPQLSQIIKKPSTPIVNFFKRIQQIFK